MKRRSLLVNGVLNVLTFLAPTFFLIILTPFFIRELGEEGYGLWMVSMSVLGLAGTAELGLGVTVSKYTAEFSASRDAEGLSTVYNSTIVFFGIIGITVGFLLYALAPSIVQLYKISDQLSLAALLALRALAWAVLPNLAISALTSVSRGLQAYAFPSLVVILQSTGSLIGAALILFADGGILEIIHFVVWLNWTLFIAAALQAWWVLRPYGIRLMISKKHLRPLLSFSAFAALSTLGGRIFTSGDRVLVGVLVGVSSVAYYSVAIGIANKVYYAVGYFSQAILPRVSELSALQNMQKVILLFGKANRLVCYFSLAGGTALFILSEPLLVFWMGNAFAQATLGTMRWLIVIYTLLGLTVVAYHVVNGMGFPQISALGSLGGGLLMTILMFPLALTYGLEGAAIANAGFLLSFVSLIFLGKLFSIRLIDTLRPMLLPLLLSFILTGLTLAAPSGNLGFPLFLLALDVTGFCALLWMDSPDLFRRLLHRPLKNHVNTTLDG